MPRRKTVPLPVEEDVLASDPWYAPSEQALDLMFFRRLFERMCEMEREHAESEEAAAEQKDEAGEQQAIGMMVVQRSMVRLLRLLRSPGTFDIRTYGINNGGTIGWWEFCVIWKEEQLTAKLSNMERLHLTLEDPNSSRMARLTSVLVLCTILVSAASFVISTMPMMQKSSECATCEPTPVDLFHKVDAVCVALFTVEYLLRVVSSAHMRTELFNQTELIERICSADWVSWPTPAQRVIRFVLAWPNMIDLVAILPSYVSWLLEATEGADGPGVHFRMAISQLTRLMRVVRALRLGRHLEAVVIVVRSMTRSVRALWLLVLNFALGMVIWGAVLFYMEQGEYDSRMGAFIRPEDGKESPFASIPHAFWFVIVTATTTGYGDMYPLTNPGKVLAGLCMVYSLCVLALPIGVIGSNFDAVWQEFDDEKRKEREWKRKAEQMAREIIECLDPLSSSRRMMIEVFHTPPSPGNNDIFIGQAEVPLELDPCMHTRVERKLRCPLIENRSKSSRTVTGCLDIEYVWTPRKPSQHCIEMEGTLWIAVIRASGLSQIDWRDSGRPDACVQLTVWPTSPSVLDATIEPRVMRTHVILDNNNPVWNEDFTVEFCWSRDGIAAKRESRRMLIDSLAVKKKFESSGSIAQLMGEGDASARTLRSLRQLSADIQGLNAAVPALQRDLERVRMSKDAILKLLELRRLDLPRRQEESGMLRHVAFAGRPGGLRSALPMNRPMSSPYAGALTSGWVDSPRASSGNSTRSDESLGAFSQSENLPNVVPDRVDAMARTLR